MKFIMALSLVAALFSCGRGRDNNVIKNTPGETIESFEYSYNGTMAYHINWYKIDRGEDGNLRLSYSHDGPDITIIKCPADALEIIDGSVRRHKLWKLSDRYMPRMEILDGYGWHLYIKYKGCSLSSGGSNAWPPQKLQAGTSEILSYVESLIESSTEADIIGTDSHDNR